MTTGLRTPSGEMEGSEGWRRVEGWLVGFVVLHSLAVGAMLLFAPGWSTRFAGWTEVDPFFFPRQAGVFHFVVSFAYMYELARFRGVTILLFTKTVAFLFLISAGLSGETAWSVPFSGVSDGLMGLSVGVVHHLARRGG